MNRDLSSKPLLRPSYVRYGVLAFACSLSMITYLDRASFGNAQGDILKSLNFSDISELTWALTAFNIAYAIFEVPTGWLGDVFGPRKTLIRIVLWWSLFVALTGLAGIVLFQFTVPGLTLFGWSIWSPFTFAFVGLSGLILVRFLFGIGEAGAYPNITRALHNWFPPHERGLTQGSVWMSGRLMGGLTPIIWMLLVVQVGAHLSGYLEPWRAAFWAFGGVGVVWCVLFALWFRNRPEEKAGVNEAERDLIRGGVGHDTDQAHARVPWGRLFRSPTLWALCLMYFCMSYGWYFNISYLPAYLEQQHGVDPKDWLGSLYKGSPLIFGALGCIVGGFLTDRFIRRTGNRRWGRRIFGMVGHSICVPLYLACLVAPSALTFALAIALTGFFNDLAMGSAWAACQDVGKKHAAIVAGCMNTVGNLGGAVATWLTGSILGWTRDAYAQTHGLDLDAMRAAAKTAETVDPAQAHAMNEQIRQVLKVALLPGYNINFIIYAAIYAVAVLLWLGIDATRPVLPEDAQTPPEETAAETSIPAD